MFARIHPEGTFIEFFGNREFLTCNVDEDIEEAITDKMITALFFLIIRRYINPCFSIEAGVVECSKSSDGSFVDHDARLFLVCNRTFRRLARCNRHFLAAVLNEHPAVGKRDFGHFIFSGSKGNLQAPFVLARLDINGVGTASIDQNGELQCLPFRITVIDKIFCDVQCSPLHIMECTSHAVARFEGKAR